ncbi:hypothetical protein [Hymenobacter humi]
MAALFSIGQAAVAQIPRVYPPAAPIGPDSVADRQTFANPSVLGMGPSKGLIVRYERMPKFGVASSAQVSGLSDFSTDVTKNARLSIKGYIPAWNRPHLKVIVGLSYEREEFKFEQRPTNYELFDNIENKGLKSTAAQIAVIRPVDEVHWYLARVKGEPGRRLHLQPAHPVRLHPFFGRSHLRLEAQSELLMGRGLSVRLHIWAAQPLPGRDLQPHLQQPLGRGGIVSGPRHGPLQHFAELDSVRRLHRGRLQLHRAPEPRALSRKNPDGSVDLSKKTLNSLELRETEVKFRLRWERELLSFLWMGAEGGYRYNYAFDAFDRTNADREKIIDSKFNGAPYASLELFITPPRKLLEKAGVRR